MSQISKCPTLRVVLGYWEALGEVSEMRYNNLLYSSSKRSYCTTRCHRINTKSSSELSTKKELFYNVFFCDRYHLQMTLGLYIFRKSKKMNGTTTQWKKFHQIFFWKKSSSWNPVIPGWQDLAGFRRGQKWPWNLSSSAYLQFSRQMRRFCA